MLDLVIKIEKITSSYTVIQNNVWCCVDGYLTQFSLVALDRIKKSDVCQNYQTISFYNNTIVAIFNKGIHCYNSELELVDSFDLRIGTYNISQNGHAVVSVEYDYISFLGTSGIFDLTEKKILWTGIKGDNLKLVNDQIFGVSKNRVSNLSPIDGSLNWSFEYEEKQTIPDIYYGNEGNVLIGFEGKNELSLINGKSGQIGWSIDSFNKGVKVDYRNSLIHQFLIGYVRYSLKTGEVLNRNVNREYYSEIEIESQRSNYALGVDHIYTTDWKKGIIGAFCLNKLKFDWIYRIKTGNFPATAKLVWITPYLLVKDSNNNLYVFKEKDSTLLQVSNS